MPIPSWLNDEVLAADFGDKRLSKRLASIVTSFASRPQSSIPESCGSWAASKATYHFFSHMNVSNEKILAPHHAETLKRCRLHRRVLAFNDTTDINYTTHSKLQGAGYLHTKKTSGFLMHSVLTASPDGVPLGMLTAEMWTRPQSEFGKSEERSKRPFAEKESARWLRAFEAAATISANGTTEVLSIGDRENDIYEVLSAERPKGAHLLVRVGQNRRILAPALAESSTESSTESDEQTLTKIKEYAASLPAQGTMDVHIAHQGSQSERTVTVQVAFGSITILPPRKKKGGVRMSIVVATEVRSAEASASRQETEPPLEWILLTSLAVESLDDARLMLRYYALRWLIERLHYTLKSGCQIEKLELETVERLQNALAVYLMVAWRLLWLVYQSRLDGQQSCEIVLETHEWQALFAVMHEGKSMPEQAPTLEQAILWIARLGGFLARKRDGAPGVKVLWRGWSRLTDIVRTWSIAQRHFSPS